MEKAFLVAFFIFTSVVVGMYVLRDKDENNIKVVNQFNKEYAELYDNIKKSKCYVMGVKTYRASVIRGRGAYQTKDFNVFTEYSKGGDIYPIHYFKYGLLEDKKRPFFDVPLNYYCMADHSVIKTKFYFSDRDTFKYEPEVREKLENVIREGSKENKEVKNIEVDTKCLRTTPTPISGGIKLFICESW